LSNQTLKLNLGDPLEYHASFVIVVKEGGDSIHPLDLVSVGRLGVSVKKTPVIASVLNIMEPPKKAQETEMVTVQVQTQLLSEKDVNNLQKFARALQSERFWQEGTKSWKRICYISLEWQGVT
jgi:hypothetical protein